MADKPTNKERLKDLGEKIEAGIREGNTAQMAF